MRRAMVEKGHPQKSASRACSGRRGFSHVHLISLAGCKCNLVHSVQRVSSRSARADL